MKDYKNLTDNELALLLINGDRYAYAEVFERYSGLLIAHAYKLLGDKDEAGDITQDIMLNLWQNREKINQHMSLGGYLYTSVRNRIFDEMSHKKVVSRHAESMVLYMEGTHVHSDETLREKELMAQLKKVIDALPQNMREVFILYKMEDLTYKEIAERLGISDKTAKQQVYNAVKILRAKIDNFLALFPFF